MCTETARRRWHALAACVLAETLRAHADVEAMATLSLQVATSTVADVTSITDTA